MSMMDDFKDLIQNCIFIHDDTESKSGVDWDQHGLNPFLLGVDKCVVDDLTGFGKEYIDYLKSINLYPKNIISAPSGTSPLVDRIIQDESCFNELLKLCDQDMGISVFYSDTLKSNLAEELSIRSKRQVRVIPTKAAFENINDKIIMWRTLKEAGIPMPYGIICESVEQLREFYQDVKLRYNEILIKRKHWDTRRINSEKMLDDISCDLKYPLIAEVSYPVKCSPVSHNLIWKQKKQHLFIVMQNIINWRHAGNYIPAELSHDENRKILSISNDILKTLKNFEGVVGIDFIITTEDEVFPVDINPRFNSSTYPFYFINSLGRDFSSTFAKYSFLDCDLPNLSVLLEDKMFTPFSLETLEGVLLFSPAFNVQAGRVEKFSYLCVAKSHEQVHQFEEDLKLLLSSLSC